MQTNSEAIKAGLGLLAAAVVTLAVSAFSAGEAAGPPGSGKAAAKSGGSLRRLVGQVTNFAEGVLFSLALGVAGNLSMQRCHLDCSDLVLIAIVQDPLGMCSLN